MQHFLFWFLVSYAYFWLNILPIFFCYTDKDVVKYYTAGIEVDSHSIMTDGNNLIGHCFLKQKQF